jgi:hypothetical protein
MEKCKNCQTDFSGNYCPMCGQKVFHKEDKSLKKIGVEIFHFFTNFDNSFFKSLLTVIKNPGQLTLDYCDGMQKKYFKPISLFFVMVVIYLLFPIFSGLNTDLKYYKGTIIFGSTIENELTDKLEKENISFEELSKKFKVKSEFASKVALFLFIPISALFIYFLFYKKNRLVYDTIILATEINIFYLLVLFFIFPIIFVSSLSIFSHLTTISSEKLDSDGFISIVSILIFIFYSSKIFKRIFNQKRWISIVKGMLFSVLHTLFLVSLYRFIVFKLVFLQL